jgi:ligand-binding sensor domain-containing protein/serine phosphatase RsbU (regulator of sigma subunit)
MNPGFPLTEPIKKITSTIIRRSRSGLFFIFLFNYQVLAQSQIVFNHLTVEDGLSQSAVTCILQDTKGFMWFGTQSGLNSYDGYSFKIFKNDPLDSNSLSNNFILSIYETPSGKLFIETQGGYFHRYNPRAESFQVVNKDSVKLENCRISTVGALLIESSGLKWTGGSSSRTGLKRTDLNTGESIIYKHNPENPYSLSDDKVYSIYRDRSGNLWIGTFNGLNRFDEKSGKFYHYKNDPNNPNSISGNWIWPIYEDSRGNLWIGTVEGGLCLFDRSSKTFTSFKNDPDDQTTINDNYIYSIYEDRTGLIWIGTNVGGVSYFDPLNEPFELYRRDPKNMNSLSNNMILSMLADSRGNYWIGTEKGGLNRLEYGTKNFTHYLHDPRNANSLKSNSIQSLYEDRSGNIWIGSYGDGLSSFDPGSNTFTHFTHNPSDPGTLTDNRIYSIAEDKDGNIWIGTYDGGVNKINRSTMEISSYQHREGDTSTLSSNKTWSIAFDDSNNLWIGTFGQGINRFNTKSKKVEHLVHNPDDSSTINDNNIIRVFKDSKGQMWFGTTMGISRYFKNSNTFKNYTERDGLSNSFVFGIVEDNKGNLWLSTSNGLSKFNPENETFKNYYSFHGLQGNEFNQNAFGKDKGTGNVLFGGLDGFNIFHPDSLKDNEIPPPIAFTGYTRYNTDESEESLIIERGIAYRDSIFLTHKDKIITLEFAALTFYNNQENQYKYKLEGFTQNWIDLGHNRSVVFTNLSPGEYSLRVIGSNSDDIWNEAGVSLFIHVSPPWWKTNIAYSAYLIIFIGVLYGIRRFDIKRREEKAQVRESALRIKATEAEKRALEIENERKTKELEEARQLQLSMLPKELPNLPDLEIAAFMRTATEVGGDYYDFLVQEDGVLDVAIGDATGHGLQAGTMVTLMKGFFTSDASKLGLQDFLNEFSKVIKDINLGRILMSFSYLKIKNSTLQITSAGMPPIYYHHKAKNEVEEIFIPGVPLGAIRNAEYSSTEKKLKSGDTILLLSDGLPELMNDKEEMFDYPRLQKHFFDNIEETPDMIIEKLVEAGDRWREDRPQDDDITFVVIRIK